MEQLTNDIDEMLARMRRQDGEFRQDDEEHISNMISEDNRRPNMSPSDEALELFRESMTEDLNAINRMRDEIDDNMQVFARGFQYLDEILEDIRIYAQEGDHVIDVEDDTGVIVIEDSDDEDAAVVVIDVDGDGSEQDIEWDEFSVSAQSSDSGFDGSVSDISDVTSYSAYSDELVHNEVCHFGFLVRPEHVREPVSLPSDALPGNSPRIPRGMSQLDIHNWLQNSETAMATGQKRKRGNSEDGADDTSQNVNGPKRKKFHNVIRQTKSNISVHNDTVGVKRSFSEVLLIMC